MRRAWCASRIPASPANTRPCEVIRPACKKLARNLLEVAPSRRLPVCEQAVWKRRKPDSCIQEKFFMKAVKKGPVFRTSLLALAVLSAHDALAQSSASVEEVVVIRSRNRLESQQDVPISVSVIQGQEIDNLLANDINSLV